MSARRNTTKKALALDEAYLDFILSRKAKLCSEGMVKLYEYNLGKFLHWLKLQGVISIDEIQGKHIRAFLSELASRKLSDSYINGYARTIKTMLRFCFFEGYITTMISFDMPKVGKKRLPYLQPEQLSKVLQACESKRDKALLLFLIDSGLRRQELCNLDWGDVDLKTGVVIVRKGKGNKARSVVIGIKTRRALLAYSREINHVDRMPVFQTSTEKRFTGMGIRSLLLRTGNKAGINLSAHALRRTFATLALKAGMSLVHIQGLMGHSSIEMTRDYIQTLTEDYIEAHKEHGPIDNFL